MVSFIQAIANDIVPAFRTVRETDVRQILRAHMLAITVCIYHPVQAGGVKGDPINLVSRALAHNDELQLDIVGVGTDLSPGEVASLQPAALLTASVSVINFAREQFGDHALGRIALEELQKVIPVPGFLTLVSA